MLLVTAVVEVITDEVKQSVASIRLFVRLFLLCLLNRSIFDRECFCICMES